MKIPVIEGIIRRRILVNYRADQEVVEAVLPKGFRPKLYRNYAVVGICLIRLEEIRPKGFPRFFGLCSENSAHRIAVEWADRSGSRREGVFVLRRDTNSKLTAIAGGRVFPGAHHYSKFTVRDQGGEISMRALSKDYAEPLFDLEVSETSDFPSSSIFGSLEESSRFFESGSIGYSIRSKSCVMDGLHLKVADWRVTSLAVKHLRSAFYDDPALFPPGSIEFDHALLMRDRVHEWHAEPEMQGIRSALFGSGGSLSGPAPNPLCVNFRSR